MVRAVRAGLRTGGDPERAEQQQRYLKSAMPMHGQSLPAVREFVRSALASYRPADRASWEATIRELWDGAEFREERYATLALLRHRVSKPFRDFEALPLYQHLIVTGAWWDLVDELAHHMVGDLLATDRSAVTPVMRTWARADDVWLRRTSVICQLTDKRQTDTDLLRYTIEANLDDDSFWLRKAIGWALRDYAKTDPAWVRDELDRLDGRLSPLSRREAAKHL